MGIFSSSRFRRLRRGGFRQENERSKARAFLGGDHRETYATNNSEPDASRLSTMTAGLGKETQQRQPRHFQTASLDTHHLANLTDSFPPSTQAKKVNPQDDQQTPSSPGSKGSRAVTESPTSIVHHAADTKAMQSPLNADDDTLALLPWSPHSPGGPNSVYPTRMAPAPMKHLETAYIDEGVNFDDEKGQYAPFYSDDLVSFFGHGNTKTGGKLRNRLQLLAAKQ